MTVRRAFLVLIAVLSASFARATTITLERGGVPVAGEVCRFRASDRENPFRRWLASADVTCAASSSITFPAGLWNVFGRADGAITPLPLLVDGDAAPGALTLRLDGAATLVAQLPPDTRAIAYVPRLGSAFPTDRVPAGETLWLFVLRKSQPLAVFPIAPLEPGTEHRVDARVSGPPAVIGWLQVPENDEAAMRSARGLTTPAVFARVGGTTRDADLLPPLASIDGAFIRLPNVSAGDGELVLQGRGWMTDRRRLHVDSALTLVGEPLTMRAVGSLLVTWSSRDDLVALDRSFGACNRDEDAAKGLITISKCAPPERPGGSPDPASCSVIREEPFDAEAKMGSFNVEDVAPGFYRAELKFGKLPAVATATTVAALQQGRLSLYPEYMKLYGSVTYGGEPIGEDVTLTFPGGRGFADAETSEYQAVVLRPIGPDAPITVAACDGTPREIVLNDKPFRRGSRLDVDIPANELTITVNDTFTREPLAGAAIRMDVMTVALPRRPTAASRTLKSGEIDDGESRVVVRAVPPDHDVILQVTHPGYQKQTVDPFSLTRSETKEVHIQLVPLRGTPGKIVSQRPFHDAVVVWYAPSGNELERADVAPDGTFVTPAQHGPSETMAVVSTSHPLWVARGTKSTTLQFPDAAPIRSFEVTLRGADPRLTRHIGLAVGGIPIPQPALRQHQTDRSLPPAALRGPGPLPFRDLAETAPLDVILGPALDEVAPRVANMNFFAIPPFVDLPRTRLPPGLLLVDLGGHVESRK